MKLFYLTISPRYARFDLFVHADTASQAADLWAEHHKADADWRPKVLKAYDLSQLALHPAVMQWDHIPCTMVR